MCTLRALVFDLWNVILDQYDGFAYFIPFLDLGFSFSIYCREDWCMCFENFACAWVLHIRMPFCLFCVNLNATNLREVFPKSIPSHQFPYIFVGWYHLKMIPLKEYLCKIIRYLILKHAYMHRSWKPFLFKAISNFSVRFFVLCVNIHEFLWYGIQYYVHFQW